MRRFSSRWLGLALAGLFLVAVGVAIGGQRDRSTGTVHAAPEPTMEDRSAARDNAAVEGDGVTAQAARTPTGAVEAATSYAVAFDGPGLLDPDIRRNLLDEHAGRDARAELERVLGEVGRLLSDRLSLDSDALDDADFVWRAVPAGWRVDSFSQHRATVAIWATGIVIARGLPLTQPSWRTTNVDVVWERGGWRLEGFTSEPGPEPPVVGGTANGASQARLIAAFRPFHHVAPLAGGPTP